MLYLIVPCRVVWIDVQRHGPRPHHGMTLIFAGGGRSEEQWQRWGVETQPDPFRLPSAMKKPPGGPPSTEKWWKKWGHFLQFLESGMPPVFGMVFMAGVTAAFWTYSFSFTHCCGLLPFSMGTWRVGDWNHTHSDFFRMKFMKSLSGNLALIG